VDRPPRPGYVLRRPLLLARAFYFLFFGAIGCYVPFINLYFRQVGLPGRAIGVLAAVPPLIMLVAGPVWGAAGDRFRIHRWLLPLAALGPIVPSLLMARTAAFGSLAALVMVAAVFWAPIQPLIDSAVLDLVAGTRHSYGSIRVWGSVGFTVMAWLMGYVVSSRGLPALFYGYAALLFGAALAALGLPARRQSWETSYRASVARLVRQPALALFLVSAFLIGATLQASYSFYPLFLTSLGAGPRWVGLAGAIGSISEMPLMFFSGPLIGSLGAHTTALLGYAVFSLRWGLLAVLASPLLVLLTNVLHCVSFSPFLTGSIAFVEQHTPPGLHATAQSLLVAVTFGLGAATGALAGGWLYDAVGPTMMFAAGSVTALVATGFAYAAGRTRGLSEFP
jgi:PPP family 3-phenylpropionic acid transporter